MLVATLAMTDDTILPFSFPAVSRKKITAAFDGGRLTSNGGVMLLAMADRRIGVAEKLSLVFPERRDATRIVHSLADRGDARISEEDLTRRLSRPAADGRSIINCCCLGTAYSRRPSTRSQTASRKWRTSQEGRQFARYRG